MTVSLSLSLPIFLQGLVALGENPRLPLSCHLYLARRQSHASLDMSLITKVFALLLIIHMGKSERHKNHNYDKPETPEVPDSMQFAQLATPETHRWTISESESKVSTPRNYLETLHAVIPDKRISNGRLVYGNHQMKTKIGLRPQRGFRHNSKRVINKRIPHHIKRHKYPTKKLKGQPEPSSFPIQESIRLDDIIGVIPGKMMKKNKPKTIKHHGKKHFSDEIKASPSFHSGKYAPPSGFTKHHANDVKVHIFRKPNQKYVTVENGWAQQKWYAPWGYFVKQPSGSHKPTPHY